MRRILLASVVVAVCCAVAFAIIPPGPSPDITSISVEPFPICVGDGVSYWAVYTGMFDKFEWQWRCIAGGTVGTWSEFADMGSGWGYFENRVGSKQWQVRGTYYGNQYDYESTNVTIHGPDHDEIIEGLDTNSYGFPFMQLIVKFQLYCGSHECGPAIDGKAQERIRKPQKGEDSGWVDETEMFELRFSTIWDTKVFSPLSPEGQAQWDGTMAGQPFDDFWQQNRVLIKNCHGDYEYFHFQDRHFQKVKVDDEHWKLVLVP